MNNTLQANIGSMIFTLEEDAFEALNGYLNDIKERFESQEHFILEDIEVRIAEILQEEISISSPIVDVDMVNRAMERIGSPEEFGERKEQPTPKEVSNKKKQSSSNRLLRLRENRIIAGVCGGLGKYFGIPAWVFRLIAIISIPFASIGIWAYLILWVCIPCESKK